MDRIIEFRMWNFVKDNPSASKMFYDVDEVMECLKQQMLFENKYHKFHTLGYDHKSDGNVFMQFTGLLDKNGKKIFQGDVIRDCITKALLEVKFGHNKNNAYQGWYCKYIGIDVRDTSLNGDYDTNQNNNIEIIGNIYENPEMIKK